MALSLWEPFGSGPSALRSHYPSHPPRPSHGVESVGTTLPNPESGSGTLPLPLLLPLMLPLPPVALHPDLCAIHCSTPRISSHPRSVPYLLSILLNFLHRSRPVHQKSRFRRSIVSSVFLAIHMQDPFANELPGLPSTVALGLSRICDWLLHLWCITSTLAIGHVILSSHQHPRPGLLYRPKKDSAHSSLLTS
jgi:hypothetical protein